MMLQLKQAGIVPKKHVLDNKVSENMKTMIRDEYNMEMELVPPGCHRRYAAEVAIQNFKSHFSKRVDGSSLQFPYATLGSITATNRNNSQLAAPIECNAKSFGICPPEWALQLQQDAISPDGMRRPSPQKDRQERHMGLPFC